MKQTESKGLSIFIFIPLSILIFIRPFFSGLAYPSLEIYYENIVIFLAIVALFFSTHFVCSKNNIVRAKSRTNTYNIPILLLVSAYLFSTITSIDIQNSIRETIKFISYFSIFFIVSQTNNRQKSSLIKTIVIAATIISLYSIYQYFWGYQHTLEYLEKINSTFLITSSYAQDILLGKRAIGTFPSPTILGGYLIIMFFLSLSPSPLWGEGKDEGIKLYIPALFTITFALILTKSMGAWLSLIFALIVLLIRSYNSLKKKKILLILSGISIILILSFILISRWERLMDLKNPQNSITQRLNYWRTAIAVIKDHPLLGVGPGNFQEVYLKYKVGMSTDTRYAHNLLFHIWAETGIFGVIAIFFLIINLFKKFITISEYKLIYLSIFTFIIHNFIDNSFFIPEVGFLWWALLSIPL